MAGPDRHAWVSDWIQEVRDAQGAIDRHAWTMSSLRARASRPRTSRPDLAPTGSMSDSMAAVDAILDLERKELEAPRATVAHFQEVMRDLREWADPPIAKGAAILELEIVHGMKHREIAELAGISRTWVTQLKRKTIFFLEDAGPSYVDSFREKNEAR